MAYCLRRFLFALFTLENAREQRRHLALGLHGCTRLGISENEVALSPCNGEQTLTRRDLRI